MEPPQKRRNGHATLCPVCSIAIVIRHYDQHFGLTATGKHLFGYKENSDQQHEQPNGNERYGMDVGPKSELAKIHKVGR